MVVHKRISVTLPEDKIRLLERVSAKRDRSALIDRAIRCYVEEAGKANLHLRLKEGYERRAVRNLETAEAWFPLGEEASGGGSR
jgi:metal-responsive CopG/Arc/MetJ family transcriptional regulator